MYWYRDIPIDWVAEAILNRTCSTRYYPQHSHTHSNMLHLVRFSLTFFSLSSFRPAAIECPEPLTDDPHLKINASLGARTLGAKIYFSCPDGYKLSGPSAITCMDNNTWSGEIAQCEGMSVCIR